MFLRQTLRKTFLLSVVFRPWCLRTEHHSRIPPTAVGGSFKLSLRQIEAYEHKYPRRESGIVQIRPIFRSSRVQGLKRIMRAKIIRNDLPEQQGRLDLNTSPDCRRGYLDGATAVPV